MPFMEGKLGDQRPIGALNISILVANNTYIGRIIFSKDIARSLRHSIGNIQRQELPPTGCLYCLPPSSFELQLQQLGLEQLLQCSPIITVMRNVQCFSCPGLGTVVITGAVEVHSMVECFGSDPFEFIRGVWLFCLQKNLSQDSEEILLGRTTHLLGISSDIQDLIK